MATGQTPLALADLPFFYSIVNIGWILYTGKIGSIEETYPAMLSAGLIGTFFVTIHPFQKLFDRTWSKNIKSGSYDKYKIKLVDVIPPEKTWMIERTYLELGLRTSSISYEKDKVVATMYFSFTLGTILISFLSGTFQRILEIERFGFISILVSLAVGIMFVFVLRAGIKQMIEFNSKLKINAVFFAIMHAHLGDSADWSLIKTAIDQNDWSTGKYLIDELLKRDWIRWGQSQ